MKKFTLILAVISLFSQITLGQDSHLSLIYDFEAEDFDYPVAGMVGTNDSLYVITGTPDNKGLFFRIDENGSGYEVIWEFDDEIRFPDSLMGNDTIIYGTTRFSANGGGAIFRYSLQDYSLEIVKDFDPNEAQEIQIKYITDSVLWFTSFVSFQDKGSIFTINKDGTDFKKIYNDTNLDKGQNPVDFVFHEDKIYIACFNGGGTPYPDGEGGFVTSGSFIRINSDGTGYENIVQGGDGVGTQPSSLIIRENKLIGLFAYSGSNWKIGGQFFQCNLDGSSYKALGALRHRALGNMLSTDSLIYGVSSNEVFGVNPFDGEIRIFDDILSNPDFGWDVCADPVFLNGHIYIAAQQKGPDNSGGTILKWSNKAPVVNEPISETILKSTTRSVNLNELFTDPEGDSLTYKLEYDESLITIEKSGEILKLTPLVSGNVDVKITANDGWTGYQSTTISTLSPTSIRTNNVESTLFLYPNPAKSTLKLRNSNIESIEIYGVDGIMHASFNNPVNEINISSLISGIYFVRIEVAGNSYVQKIIKN